MEDSKYFEKWSKIPGRTLLKGPSYVQAIVSCQNRQSGTTNLVVVCRKGEIIALSHKNLNVTDWTSLVQPPAGHEISFDRFQIEYATFDSISENFLFVLHSPGDKEIFWAGKASLMNASEKNTGVQLKVLISSQQNNNRSFGGIAIDADRRVLYICNYEQGTIDLWFLETAVKANEISLIASQVGIINLRDSETNMKIEPWYCAIFYLPNCQNDENSNKNSVAGKLLLAVSDWESSSVILYVNSNLKSLPFLPRSNGSNKMDMLGFEQHGIIANASDEFKDVGTVTFPHEMCFDVFGNLLVADAVNDRLQMFTVDESLQFRPAWATEGSCYHDRAIIVCDPESKKFMALANNFDSVIAYE